jgi:epoxide hydrolase-like predicted phosphatase
MSTKAIVFDIGGVLVRTVDWSGRRKWEIALGMPERALSILVFDCEPAIRASLGQGPDTAIWEHVASQLRLGSAQLVQLHADFWSGDRLNSELLQFTRLLHAKWKTGLLSNAWPEMRDMNQRIGLDKAFDEVVYSFQIGVLKPNLRAYQAILQKLEVTPSETVFVDDFAKNLDGARAAGMSTVHFHDTQQAIAELKGLLAVEG